jgi:hypothetical protein
MVETTRWAESESQLSAPDEYKGIKQKGGESTLGRRGTIQL